MATRKKAPQRKKRRRKGEQKPPDIVKVMALTQCFIDNKLREPGQIFSYDQANWGSPMHPDSPVIRLDENNQPEWDHPDAPPEPRGEEGPDGEVKLPWVTGGTGASVPGTI